MTTSKIRIKREDKSNDILCYFKIYINGLEVAQIANNESKIIELNSPIKEIFVKTIIFSSKKIKVSSNVSTMIRCGSKLSSFETLLIYILFIPIFLFRNWLYIEEITVEDTVY